jgi:hypothetical protein
MHNLNVVAIEFKRNCHTEKVRKELKFIGPQMMTLGRRILNNNIFNLDLRSRVPYEAFQ